MLSIVAGRHDGRGINGLAPNTSLGLLPVQQVDCVERDERELVRVALSCDHRTIFLLERQARRVFEVNGRPEYSDYLPLEAFSPTRAAIKDMIELQKVHVVEAAGNGASFIDNEVRDLSTGSNDTGAIMVGALDHQAGVRHLHSNFGNRVNLNAWGTAVLAAGGAIACEGWGHSAEPARCYTYALNGTSSATAIIGGVVACVCGVLEASGIDYDPACVRRILVETGHLHDAQNQIGVQPDLEAALREFGRSPC